MENLFTLWYLRSPAQVWEFYLRVINSLEISIGVRDMLRNIRRPLFQDYTWGGRLIGLIFRLLRILIGCMLYLGVAALFLTLYIAWLLFPAVCIVSLIGSLFGRS